MNNNDDRMDQLLSVAAPELKAIKDLMDQTNTMAIDIIRSLYLVDMIKKVTRYGKVGFTIKDGEIVSVWHEGQFISEKELTNNLNALINRK
jgi:hypothetical protein